MSEQLIIRLASEANQSIHWLIWSDSEKEIIGSGEIDNALALQQLSEKAQSRQVVCLVPAVDMTLKSVPVSGTFTRQMQQALPYMLEDDLASDVEKLHFSVFFKETDLVQVAICAKSKLEAWLDWLSEAEIVCQRFIPEVLALPFSDTDKWQAVQLGEHWIVRESLYTGWGCESDILNEILQLRLIENEDQIIESYSPVPAEHVGNWEVADAVLPMQLFAEGCVNNRHNILTGEFKVKKESNLHLDKWKVPAIATVILLVVALANLFMQSEKAASQTLVINKQVETIYKKAFPSQGSLKHSRIKKKLKSLLVGLSSKGTNAGLLIMLNDLLPVFQNVPSLQISTLKFKQKNQEINLGVSADSFQAFEQLAAKIPAKYLLEQGALSNNKNRVKGALTVRLK